MTYLGLELYVNLTLLYEDEGTSSDQEIEEMKQDSNDE